MRSRNLTPNHTVRTLVVEYCEQHGRPIPAAKPLQAPSPLAARAASELPPSRTSSFEIVLPERGRAFITQPRTSASAAMQIPAYRGGPERSLSGSASAPPTASPLAARLGLAPGERSAAVEIPPFRRPERSHSGSAPSPPTASPLAERLGLTPTESSSARRERRAAAAAERRSNGEDAAPRDAARDARFAALRGSRRTEGAGGTSRPLVATGSGVAGAAAERRADGDSAAPRESRFTSLRGSRRTEASSSAGGGSNAAAAAVGTSGRDGPGGGEAVARGLPREVRFGLGTASLQGAREARRAEAASEVSRALGMAAAGVGTGSRSSSSTGGEEGGSGSQPLAAHTGAGAARGRGTMPLSLQPLEVASAGAGAAEPDAAATPKTPGQLAVEEAARFTSTMIGGGARERRQKANLAEKWKTEREERQLSEQRKSTAAALKEKRRLELERLRPAAGAELPARRERRPTGEWSAGQSRRAFERKQRDEAELRQQEEAELQAVRPALAPAPDGHALHVAERVVCGSLRGVGPVRTRLACCT